MPGDDDSDLVTLAPFMDYINDPTLLQALMEQQGVQNISSVEPTGPLGGGTADNNYKGYIHWLDGTQTKVQIKGSRTGDPAPASYREQMFYSRVTETLNDDVHTVPSYTSVADLDTNQGLFVNEFMTGFTSLQDVITAYLTGTLDDIGFPDFDILQNTFDIMTMLGHFHGSHWVDPWLKTQFYMKGYDWTSEGDMTAGEAQYMQEKSDTNNGWKAIKLNPFIKLDDTFKACMDKVMEMWTWENFQANLNSADYMWTVAHGDFHPGQVMISSDDNSDLILLDWEWSGFSNPAIDLSVWFNFFPTDFLLTNTDDWLLTYYKALLSENKDIYHSYMFEDLKADFLYYGSAHIFVRNVGLLGGCITSDPSAIAGCQWMMDQMGRWTTEHNLTPDHMATPMYQLF